MYDETFPNEIDENSKIKKVLIVSGQFYYNLIERREKLKNKDIAIVRLEQITPFPYQRFINIVS